MITLNLYRDAKRQFCWRVRASNGEIMANGAGDGYKRRRDLDIAIHRVFAWDQHKGCGLGQVMKCNRTDMKLEDDTILSHVMKASATKRVRAPRKRTSAQKAARAVFAVKKSPRAKVAGRGLKRR